MKATSMIIGYSMLMTCTFLSAQQSGFSQEIQKKQISNWDLGVIGGVNFSQLSIPDKQINSGYTWGSGYNAGIAASYKFYKYLSIAGEAYFADLRSTSKGIQALMPGSPLQTTPYQRYANFEKKERLNYIEVPLMIRITTGDKIKYYANVGPFVGFAIGARMETSGSSILFLDKQGNYTEPINGSFHSIDQGYDNMKNINSVNFGIAAGAGTGYTIGKHGIWLDGRYDVGLTGIRNNTSVNGQNNLETIMVRLCYTYNMGK